MLPMPIAVHLVPVALVLAVRTPHPSDSVSVAYDVHPIPTVNPPEISGGMCSWLRTRIGRDLIRLGYVKQKDVQRRLCGSHVLPVYLVLIF